MNFLPKRIQIKLTIKKILTKNILKKVGKIKLLLMSTISFFHKSKDQNMNVICYKKKYRMTTLGLLMNNLSSKSSKPLIYFIHD